MDDKIPNETPAPSLPTTEELYNSILLLARSLNYVQQGMEMLVIQTEEMEVGLPPSTVRIKRIIEDSKSNLRRAVEMLVKETSDNG